MNKSGFAATAGQEWPPVCTRRCGFAGEPGPESSPYIACQRGTGPPDPARHIRLPVAERAAAAAALPVVPVPQMPRRPADTVPTGDCGSCGRRYGLQSGIGVAGYVVASHGPFKQRCAGSWQPPVAGSVIEPAGAGPPAPRAGRPRGRGGARRAPCPACGFEFTVSGTRSSGDPVMATHGPPQNRCPGSGKSPRPGTVHAPAAAP